MLAIDKTIYDMLVNSIYEMNICCIILLYQHSVIVINWHSNFVKRFVYLNVMDDQIITLRTLRYKHFHSNIK